MEQKKHDYIVKNLILGDSAVGKTCLLLRFADNDFTEHHMPTIGVDFKIKSIMSGTTKLKMQIWDTAGQERYQTITQTYYKSAIGIVMCYSVVDRKSFLNIQSWVKQIEQNADKHIVRLLIANKIDFPQEEHVVSKDEGEELAKKYGIPFFEASAKQSINVTEAFDQLAKDTVSLIEKFDGKLPGVKVAGARNLYNKKHHKPGRCCQ